MLISHELCGTESVLSLQALTSNCISCGPGQKERVIEARKPVTDQETNLFKLREQEEDFAPL